MSSAAPSGQRIPRGTPRGSVWSWTTSPPTSMPRSLGRWPVTRGSTCTFPRKRGVTRPDLIDSIHTDSAVNNDDPSAYIWTATVESILANIARARTTLNERASQNRYGPLGCGNRPEEGAPDEEAVAVPGQVRARG